MKIGRKKLTIGDVYFDALCDSNKSELIYVGRFLNKEHGSYCLCFWPIKNNGYLKEKDGTICFLDSPSFFMYEVE